MATAAHYLKQLGCLCLLVMLPILGYANQVTTLLSKQQVALGETFQVIYRVAAFGQSVQPDFSPLERDFTILGQTYAQSLQVINGRATRSSEYRLTLLAKAAGQFTLPAIDFSGLMSEQKSLTVSEQGSKAVDNASEDVFLEASVSSSAPYVQSQVIYSLKLFYAVPITSPSFSDLPLSDAIVVPLGQDKRYQASRNGRNYNVYQRDYAIFPQQSGSLTIPSPVFSGIVADSAMGDPFLARFGHRLHLRAGLKKLKVKPIASSFNGATWLPARSLSLSETWSSSAAKLTQGKPITRTIRLQANGLAAAQLPSLASLTETPGFKVYAEKPLTEQRVLQGSLVSELVQRFTYIPDKPGKLTLPELRLPWWDVKSDSLSYATLPAKSFQVTATPGYVAHNDPSAEAGQEPLPAKSPAPQSEQSSEPQTYKSLILVVVMLSLLMGLLFLLRQQLARRWQRFMLCHKLKQACKKNQAKDATHYLLAWLNLLWPGSGVKTLGAVKQRLATKKFREVLAELEQALYAQQSTEWQGRELLRAIPAIRRHTVRLQQKAANPLPALFSCYEHSTKHQH